MIKQYIEALMAHARTEPTDYGDGESVLTMLYECYSDSNRMDDEQIRADFRELYAMMNGMTIREMDKIIYPVCSLCRDHQRVGFTEGVKIGLLLAGEVMEDADSG